MEEKPPQENQSQANNSVVTEARGKWTIKFNDKSYSFEFPVNFTLAENYAVITYLKNEVFKAIEIEKKQEEEKDCPKCEENIEKDTKNCKK